MFPRVSLNKTKCFNHYPPYYFQITHKEPHKLTDAMPLNFKIFSFFDLYFISITLTQSKKDYDKYADFSENSYILEYLAEFITNP